MALPLLLLGRVHRRLPRGVRAPLPSRCGSSAGGIVTASPAVGVAGVPALIAGARDGWGVDRRRSRRSA